MEVPGPGTYAPKVEITPTGFYFNSNFVSSRVRSFGREPRKDMTQQALSAKFAPGPGAYRAPSEFGYYEVAQSQTARTGQRILELKSNNIAANSTRE